jgi:hypothetical protein
MTGDALVRVARAAATHGWSVSVPDSQQTVMATRDSGRVGEPWVVMAESARSGLRISLFEPGDALDAGGEELGELSGNPRELGRQLRTMLEELTEGRAA